MLLYHISMLLYYISMLLYHISMLLNLISMLLNPISMLLNPISLLPYHTSMLLYHISMLQYHISILWYISRCDATISYIHRCGVTILSPMHPILRFLTRIGNPLDSCLRQRWSARQLTAVLLTVHLILSRCLVSRMRAKSRLCVLEEGSPTSI